MSARFYGTAPCRVVTSQGTTLMPTLEAALQRFDPAEYARFRADAAASMGGCEAALEEYGDSSYDGEVTPTCEPHNAPSPKAPAAKPR